MRLYVYSTLASDMRYTNHVSGGGDLPLALPSVFVAGGAGVANDRLVTPRGVVTEVSEEQAEYLRANAVFRLHETNGYVRIEGEQRDADKVAADMTGRDESAPVVPQDLPEDGQPNASGESPSSRKRR